MQILITGKKIQISPALRSQTEDKINDVTKKYNLTPLECTTTFSKDGPLVKCEIEMHLGHELYVRAHVETDDAYLSLEQALDTFEKRLRRQKKRLTDHYKKRDIAYQRSPAFQYVINPQEETNQPGENPLIIAEMQAQIPSLTVSEAVMHLDLSDEQALLFTNVAHNQLNVVYRRNDGNIGWIAPTKNEK